MLSKYRYHRSWGVNNNNCSIYDEGMAQRVEMFTIKQLISNYTTNVNYNSTFVSANPDYEIRELQNVFLQDILRSGDPLVIGYLSVPEQRAAFEYVLHFHIRYIHMSFSKCLLDILDKHPDPLSVVPLLDDDTDSLHLHVFHN